LCKRLAERGIGEPVLTYRNYRAWKTSPQPALRRHNGSGCWGEFEGLEGELLRQSSDYETRILAADVKSEHAWWRGSAHPSS
jgi:hypothetical protein